MKHPLVRPPRGFAGTLFAKLRVDGRWVKKDDGAPGLAFLFNHPDLKDAEPGGMLFVASCSCKYADCVVAKGLNYATRAYDCTTVVRRPAARSK